MTKVKMHHDFHAEFADHCTTTFGDGVDYVDYEPYYQFGQECALEDAFADRPYADAEDDVRELHESRYPDVDFDTVEAAVRYAYSRTRASMR